MCTIFGFNAAEPTAYLDVFLNTQRHRGPEYENYTIQNGWLLGHQRLSIIDTSSNANQPMTKNGHTLILNGEIYNYIELKEQYLKDVSFNTTSDTEVLLEMLISKGTSIVNKLNGMFAFAWLNHASGDVFLCRDRFGVKPLHYMIQQDVFYFSSEIKPLIRIKNNLALNPGIIKTFMFDTATDFDEQTFIKGIEQLKPGHCMLLKMGEKEIKQTPWYAFADFDTDTHIFNDFKGTLQYFEQLLTDAIKIRHRADVPVCITLSGGLDSTTIYTLTKEHISSNIKPFTFLHPGSETNEYDIVKKLTNDYSDTLVEVFHEVDDSLDFQKNVLRFLEFPIWNNSGTAYYEMYRAIKKSGFTVVVEGHGSDEQLGGYPYLVEAAVEQELYYARFKNAYRLQKVANQTHNPYLNQKGTVYSSYSDFLLKIAKPHLRHLLGNLLYNRPPLLLRNHFQKTVEQSFDYKIIPIVLRTFDRLSMANSLESRSPFMDFRIVEFLRKTPLKYKVNNIGSKALLREILKKYNKDYIYKNKAKMGFASDAPRFYNSPVNKLQIIDLVNGFNDTDYSYFKDIALNNLKKDHIGWRDIGEIWKILSLQLTKQLYGLQ